MASLAAGDTRCGNGGASITDGTGNTAYPCNGGTGALDLHSFSVASTAALTLTTGQAPAVVPGLSVQVTPAIASTYFVNADIWLALNCHHSGLWQLCQWPVYWHWRILRRSGLLRAE